MSSKADALGEEACNCAASYSFEACNECEGDFTRSGYCELSMRLAVETIDELKHHLRTVKRLSKKYGDKYNEPETVGRLMWFMAQDQRYTTHNKDGTTRSLGNFKKLLDIYQVHFGSDEEYNVDGCPHCNAFYLNTTVAELIECIECDIAYHSTKDYEESDE
jgi:hypothetical protein